MIIRVHGVTYFFTNGKFCANIELKDGGLYWTYNPEDVLVYQQVVQVYRCPIEGISV